MKRIIHCLLVMFMSVFLLTVSEGPLMAASVSLSTGTLSEKAVTKLFSDKTVQSVSVRKGRVSLTYYNPNGSIEQLRNGIKRYGIWWVTKNGRICLAFAGSKEKCRIIVKAGKTFKKYIVKKNGQHRHSVSYRKFLSGKQL
ncbi:MAG: hypothetical protein J7K90_03850 [Desulfuromusa sp.]|nr:hypothetical protein [Desulfuromusa sp.]